VKDCAEYKEKPGKTIHALFSTIRNFRSHTFSFICQLLYEPSLL